MSQFKITILLPTRGRTDALERSVKSIVNRAVDLNEIQILFAFDNDDTVGQEYFTEHVQPWLDKKEVEYTAMLFEPMTYGGLNIYYNTLADDVDTDWFFIWNDDAIMETAGWDRIIKKHTGEFKILKVHTHGEHPYSIFPIVPRAWFDLLGYFSRHQMIDAEISQNAYMLDVIEIVDIYVTHDRADLTGNNKDETDAVRVRYEGNPADPKDFHNYRMFERRLADTSRLADYMKKNNINTDWFEQVRLGNQDPWVKMRENDINNQMHTIQLVPN